jgi:D-arabinose 1-dehydrogenase-like Zn-dependent alcohol dehydrogenase
MADKTRASVLVAPREFELMELSLPEIGPDDGLLKLQACGVCGSDVHGYQRLEPGPRILGHENVGVVAKVGREAARRWGVKEGDRVALEEYIPCGACKWCRSDDFRFCPQTDVGGSGPRLWYGSTALSIPGPETSQRAGSPGPYSNYPKKTCSKSLTYSSFFSRWAAVRDWGLSSANVGQPPGAPTPGRAGYTLILSTSSR